MTRATALVAYLLDSVPFWLGVSAGLTAAAVVLAVVTLVDTVRERRARRAARYRGRRRKSRRAPTAEQLGAMSVAAMQAKALAKRGPSSPRPPVPWAGRSERPGLMARLGGWHR